MKYIGHSWGNQNDGILFFVQRLQEMLFHYSDDIVKAPVHNSATLIMEYLITDKDVSVQKYHLDYIAEELKDSLERDSIAKSCLGTDNINRIISEMKNDQGNLIKYLYSSLPFEVYHKKTCLYLLEKINNPNQKEEIEYALRTWIASVVYGGYRSEYIYRHLNKLFAEVVGNPYEVAENFINHFDFEKKEYAVYLNFYKSVKPYKDLLSQRLEVIFEDDGNFEKIGNTKYKNESFVGKIIVKELDPYEAISEVYQRLDIFFSFYRVISNRGTQLLGKNGLVICDAEEMKLPVVTNGYKAIELEPRINLESTIDNMVIGCQKKDIHTYYHLQKMIRLHNMALIQPDLSDGFVNLWSILEVASSDASLDSKIKNVVHSILPILQNDYYYKIFSSILDDLSNNLSKADMRMLFEKVKEGKDDRLHKIIAFIVLPQYEKLREEFFEKLRDFPNIRQKIYKIYITKDNKNKMIKISDTYAQRIEWHLYRLYRVRNAIVHAGDTDRNIRVLGEHLHIYCDSVIIELITKLASNDNLSTVKDVLIDTKLLLGKKKEYLKEGGAFVDEDISHLRKEYL